MVRGLCVPYEKFSVAGVGGWPGVEIISRGAFAASVACGRSLRTGRSIHVCWGHRRVGPRWRIGSTLDGRLHLFETREGVFFELAGATLPPLFAGCSILMEPIRVRYEPDGTRRVLMGGIRHVALLTAPSQPSYPQTFWATACPSF